MRRLLVMGARRALGCSESSLQASKPEARTTIRFLSASALKQQDQEASSSGGWMPSWLKSKLPSALGGDKTYDELEDMTLDKYAKSLKQARMMGGLTGFVHGSGRASDPTAQGSLRMYENIIGAMTTEEKADLSLFKGPARERVAAEVGCRVSQVDDCIAKYMWMKQMSSKMGQLKREGKELPRTVEEVEAALGNWRQYKSEAGPGGADGPTVPFGYKRPGGQLCGLAGSDAGRNSKCPATGKAFKSCCGKKLLKG